MDDFRYREKFRIRMWKALNISFPRMVFRRVVNLLGEKQTRVLFDLLKNKEFSYLPFVISPELPYNMEQKYRDLFENPKFIIAVNIIRIARIEDYLVSNLSEPVTDFIAILLHYLRGTEKCYRMNLSDKVLSCSGSAFREVKEQFRKEEKFFMEKAEFLPLDEKYVVCCISTLCLEELSDKSRLKLETIFAAQRSSLAAIGELQ